MSGIELTDQQKLKEALMGGKIKTVGVSFSTHNTVVVMGEGGPDRFSLLGCAKGLPPIGARPNIFSK